ncbi:uncharacterized protein FIESC28_03888 [Fusarium coffeatum]|uniref:Uncharacterized protein n=1 Tax=Fusarium coffeatum TaxID=231269 RepID=A0A366S3T2_9HYPO|nr:uncharacterized protein FIESC28_03888 [Fusarium coffeatum]RBR23305.1 hypothetical protein FIESC28_03888 [Fusarium coffeatum]
MVADKDAHTGDSTPKCVTCAQLCVLEQTGWVCTYCREFPDMQRSFDALRLDSTATAHDTRESRDSSAVDYFPRTLTHQGGNPCDLRAMRSNEISQLGNNHHDDGSMASPSRVGAKQDTLERQDSFVSPQIDDSAHEYVPFGTHNTGDGQGQSDEDIDLEDVDNIDNNNIDNNNIDNNNIDNNNIDNNNIDKNNDDDDEEAQRESFHSWLQGTGGMGMVERHNGLEATLRKFENAMAPRTDSNMAQYGDEEEPSDDVEMEE